MYIRVRVRVSVRVSIRVRVSVRGIKKIEKKFKIFKNFKKNFYIHLDQFKCIKTEIALSDYISRLSLQSVQTGIA